MQLTLEVRNGILVAFGGFLWLLLENAMGLHSKYLDYQPFFFWLIILLPLVVFYYTIKYIRDKRQQGFIKFIDILRSGAILTASASLATPLFVWLYVSVVNPTYLLSRQDHALKMLFDLNLDPNTQILREESIKGDYATFSYLISSLVFALAVCSTLSIILSILIRKKPQSTTVSANIKPEEPVN